MNQVIKTDWIRALRSGDYTQGNGYLKQTPPNKDVTYHCCLGVLCELVEPDAFYQAEYGVFEHHGLTGIPNVAVAETTGLDREDMNKLAKLNDQGLDFNAIANVIEVMF